MVLRNVVNGKVPLAQSALAHIRWISSHAAFLTLMEKLCAEKLLIS